MKACLHRGGRREDIREHGRLVQNAAEDKASHELSRKTKLILPGIKLKIIKVAFAIPTRTLALAFNLDLNPIATGT